MNDLERALSREAVGDHRRQRLRILAIHPQPRLFKKPLRGLKRRQFSLFRVILPLCMRRKGLAKFDDGMVWSCRGL